MTSPPTSPDDPERTPFAALGLRPALLSTLTALGYEEPTPIQQAAIPPLLAGRDVLGQAATGTGKTAAFALPLLQRISGGADESAGSGAAAETPRGRRPVRALVLVPTRELSMQVSEAIYRYGKELATRVIPIYGGQPIERQLRALKNGVDVVVATPGRALDHLRRRTLDLTAVQLVVLDEADEMLDMGFAEDIEALLQATPPGRQTALFSATMPPRITGIAKRHMRDPVQLLLGARPAGGKAGGKAGATAGTAAGLPLVRQSAYLVTRPQKVAALVRLLDVERPAAALIFCRTRIDVTELTESLNARGYQADPLHGGLSQEQRDRVMRRFRGGQAELLVATDVAARGLDVEHVSHVVNFDLPSAPEAYVHRIGRTGRAGRAGAAITLIEPREHRLLRNIEQLTGDRITLATLPTVADLRARQLEITRSSLREILVQGELETFRPVIEALSSEFDVMEIALAAVKLAHGGSSQEGDDTEIPVPTLPSDRWPARTGAPGSAGPATGRGPGRPSAPAGPPGRPAPRSPRPARRPDWTIARVYIGAGRLAGLLPRDLVGAIANETGLNADAIGTITLFDEHSVVELPDEVLDEILPILQRIRFKGHRVEVRREDAPAASATEARAPREDGPARKPASKPPYKPPYKAAGKPPGKAPSKPPHKPPRKPTI